MMNLVVHFRLFQHIHPHSFRIQNSDRPLHLAANPSQPEMKTIKSLTVNLAHECDKQCFEVDKCLLDLAKLAAEVKSRRVYCKQGSIEFDAIAVLAIELDFQRQSIHRKMWFLVSAKTFS